MTGRTFATVLLLALSTADGVQETGLARQPFHPVVTSCDAASLAATPIAGTVVDAATNLPPGYVPRGARGPFAKLPGFCRIEATARSSPDSIVTFEVWIPDTWNGKLVVTGNGGYSNALNHGDMAHALSQGYAAVGGDTGHQTATPDDLLWGVDHPARILDWGTRSIHAIVGPARTIIERVRGARPRRAYFYGCSTGGHQGYAEIQRYPADFDGVIAGAPGNNRVRLNAAFLWQFLANRERQQPEVPIVPASKLPVVTRAVVAACDANDGVSDGVVDDPRSCRFDHSALECAAGDAADCLTRAQIRALDKMYVGAKNPRTGEQVYPGWPRSSEALTTSPDGRPQSGWHLYWGGSEPMRASFWRLWVFKDASFDWWSFDFDRHLALADATVGRLIDHVDPDIDDFKSRGGKAIVYQGWQDPVVNAIDTIAYYENVRRRQGSQPETDRFFRLFLVPGMGHCAGGTGATVFGNTASPAPIVDARHDLLSALDAWVERGLAPDVIVASRVVDGVTVRTRPLCPYPQRAVNSGRGSPDLATSSTCR